MRIALSLSCAAAFACLSVPAVSAENSFELTEVSGKVLLTTEDGALPAALGQQLPEGTRIFVGDDAIARIASADGSCSFMLPTQKVTIVDYKNLCGVQITPTASDYAPGGLPPPVVGLMFFGGAATVVAISIATNDKDDPVPVSAP